MVRSGNQWLGNPLGERQREVRITKSLTVGHRVDDLGGNVFMKTRPGNCLLYGGHDISRAFCTSCSDVYGCPVVRCRRAASSLRSLECYLLETS